MASIRLRLQIDDATQHGVRYVREALAPAEEEEAYPPPKIVRAPSSAPWKAGER